jgi:hypothetical protein
LPDRYKEFFRDFQLPLMQESPALIRAC